QLIGVLLIEHIPGGAKWRYVWGSCLAFVFMLQLITGLLLMTAYSPGDSTAWGSVYFIQYEMEFGWLIRGLHHFGSQTMVVLLGLHMLQVVIAGAQLPPREINWWLGLALMGLVLGLSLTGYLLPWDQKGFFATQVATNILGSLPGIGTFLQKVVVGVMVGLVIFGGQGNKVEAPASQVEVGLYERMAQAGREGLGANLDALADPLAESYPARPELYFLFLYQLHKYFEGEHFLVG